MEFEKHKNRVKSGFKVIEENQSEKQEKNPGKQSNNSIYVFKEIEEQMKSYKGTKQ